MIILYSSLLDPRSPNEMFAAATTPRPPPKKFNDLQFVRLTNLTKRTAEIRFTRPKRKLALSSASRISGQIVADHFASGERKTNGEHLLEHAKYSGEVRPMIGRKPPVAKQGRSLENEVLYTKYSLSLNTIAKSPVRLDKNTNISESSTDNNPKDNTPPSSFRTDKSPQKKNTTTGQSPRSGN